MPTKNVTKINRLTKNALSERARITGCIYCILYTVQQLASLTVHVLRSVRNRT